MSSHLRSLERRNLVFGIIAVALAAVLLLRPDAVTSVDKEALPLLFPDFEKDAIRRVELARAATSDTPEKRLDLSLVSGGNLWVLSSHHSYPAQAGANALLDAVASARVRAEVTRRADTFEKYAGTDGWIDVNLVDSRGKDVLSFALGRYTYPETFVRVGAGDDQRVVKVINLSPGQAAVESRSWIELRIWPELTAGDAVRIDVEQRRDERTITVVKRGSSLDGVDVPAASEDAEKIWWMTSPETGDAKKLAVEDLAREFSGMLIEDIVGGAGAAVEEARHGFDDPELVVTLHNTVDGKVSEHKLEVGKQVEGEETRYVRRAGAPWVYTVKGSSFGRMRQAPEEFLAPPPAPVPDDPQDGDAKGVDAKDAKDTDAKDTDGKDAKAADGKDAKAADGKDAKAADGKDAKKDD